MITTEFSAQTPISQLTVGEFLQLLSDHGQPLPQAAAKPDNESKGYVYGIGGLARLIGSSYPTAHRLKASGAIPFTQVGRKVIFNEVAVLAALNKSQKQP